MALTVSDVQSQERDGLLGEYTIAEIPPYVAIPSISELTGTPSRLRAKYPLVIEPIGERTEAGGFVQISPGLNYKFLWLRPKDGAYKEKYGAYLKKYYDIDAIPAGYEVDHLFNKARAIDLELVYIRMALVGKHENASHGAGYEKSRTKGGIGAKGRARGIDEITLMKLCGISSPRKNRPLSREILGHVQRVAAMFGMSPMEIEQNIRELMEVAAFRSGSVD
jgi:hypothetical protein